MLIQSLVSQLLVTAPLVSGVAIGGFTSLPWSLRSIGSFSGAVAGSSVSETTEDGIYRRASVWQPAVGSSFQMILYGILNLNASDLSVTPNVAVYDLDLFDTPKESITALHRLGKKVICYFSAGTSESWRPDFQNFTEADLGTNLTYWPGERWLDIRSTNVMKIMKERIKMAADKGCDAVDPDDVDVYSNDNGGGFKSPVTQADSVKFFKALSDESHKYNVAIGLKNSLEMLSTVRDYAEFAVNEECAWEQNCNSYADFTAGKGSRKNSIAKPVFHVEYVDHVEFSLLAPNSTTNTTMPPPMYTLIFSWLWPNISDVTLLSILCLNDGTPKSTGKAQLSTALKQMTVDGWMMDCNGHSAITYVTPPNRTAPTKGQQPGQGSSASGNSKRGVSRPVKLPIVDEETAVAEAKSIEEKRKVDELPERKAMKERKRAWRQAKRDAAEKA